MLVTAVLSLTWEQSTCHLGCTPSFSGTKQLFQRPQELIRPWCQWWFSPSDLWCIGHGRYEERNLAIWLLATMASTSPVNTSLHLPLVVKGGKNKQTRKGRRLLSLARWKLRLTTTYWSCTEMLHCGRKYQPNMSANKINHPSNRSLEVMVDLR